MGILCIMYRRNVNGKPVKYLYKRSIKKHKVLKKLYWIKTLSLCQSFRKALQQDKEHKQQYQQYIIYK